MGLFWQHHESLRVAHQNVAIFDNKETALEVPFGTPNPIQTIVLLQQMASEYGKGRDFISAAKCVRLELESWTILTLRHR